MDTFITENTETDTQTHATSKPSHSVGWLVWVLPVLAILMAAWLVYRALPGTGSSITLAVSDAENIHANSTLVFHRGVRVGIVKEVVLTADNASVDLVIDLAEGREDFARSGARYWVVKPELDNASLEGLTTIVSGPEIHAQPGSGEPQSAFVLEDNTPLPDVSDEDLVITLQTSQKETLGRGSRINYRDMRAGVVTSVALAADSSYISIEANIYPGFSHLVRTHTVFWNSGGLEVDFGLFSGAQVRSSSLSSLFVGEISFATPDEPGERVESGHVFSLAGETEDDWLEWEPKFAANGDVIREEK